MSSAQRAGRSGRTAPGQCYRLYSEECFAAMLPETVPEIQRTSLSNTVLYLKALGLMDVLGFDFLDPPSADQLSEALVELHVLGALDDQGVVTLIGGGMSRFPVEPSIARMLVAAADSGERELVEDVVAIAAMLSVEQIWVEKPLSGLKRKASEDRGRGDSVDQRARAIDSAQSALRDERGDHFTLLRVFREWEAAADGKEWCERHFVKLRALRNARNIYSQLLPDAKACLTQTPASDRRGLSSRRREELVRFSILQGLFMNAARRCSPDSTVYRSCDLVVPGASDGVRLLHLHPDSSLVAATSIADYVVYQVRC